MCNIHDIEKKSVTVWILVHKTRIQYLSTLLRPAQAHKHFHFPATALYFWVLGIQHPPVKKKKWIWNKGNGEVYSTENYYWGRQTWNQWTHGSKLYTASSEKAKPNWAWGKGEVGGGGWKVEKAWKDRDRRREMKEGVSPQFPWEHFPRSQLTRGSFAKVTSLRASSSLFRVTSDGPRENALASPFACRSRVTSHGISPTACSQARWYPVRTTPFFAESRFFMVKICFNIACYIGIWNMWF